MCNACDLESHVYKLASTPELQLIADVAENLAEEAIIDSVVGPAPVWWILFNERINSPDASNEEKEILRGMRREITLLEEIIGSLKIELNEYRELAAHFESQANYWQDHFEWLRGRGLVGDEDDYGTPV